MPSEPAASTLLGVVVSRFETQLDNALGYCMADSKERMAIVSLIYNGGAGRITVPLKDAITNDNRAEAWFEIRYNSNRSNLGGIASRRYTESNMFNLYDAGDYTPEGTKEIMRMYLLNKDNINRYERSYPPSTPLRNNIMPAFNYLVTTFGEGTFIHNVIVGKGLESYKYLEFDQHDDGIYALEGTDFNDLIFGEAGNDEIYAGKWNDVIYGGADDDKLYGEEGDDTLIGGAGNDILNGSWGYDTYKVSSYEIGSDTIQDYDGSGQVKLDGLILTGGAKDDSYGSGAYRDENSNIYRWNGRNWSDLVINDSIRVENFYNGKLNIHLTGDDTNDDPPTDPTPPGFPPGRNGSEDGSGPLGGGCDEEEEEEYSDCSGGIPPDDGGPDNTASATDADGGSGDGGGCCSDGDGSDDVDETDDSYDCGGDKYDDAGDAAIPTGPLSPIILDLDGDGVETTGVKAGAYFDHDGNGFAEQTGWAAPDDGLLVMDRDGNGAIDNGKELFGNETLLADGTKATNGFQALSELDDNKDGKIDANDAAWSQLKVWKDTDGDGISAGNELHTLDELGIASINTGYTDSTTVDANGNEHRQIGGFTKTDGTTGQTADVWFKTDKGYTIANEWLDVPEDIAGLPDLRGYGNVYNLHQAMTREAISGQQSADSLKSLVEQFMATTDVNTRNSLMEQILFKWTGSDAIDPNSRGPNIDARRLAALEKLFGKDFIQSPINLTFTTPNPAGGAVALLDQSYIIIFEMYYAKLMSQTHLKGLYDKITYRWDEATQERKADLSAVIAEIQTQLTNDPAAGKALLSEFSRSIKGFNAGAKVDAKGFYSSFAMQSDELAWIIDSAGKNLITGTAGNDTLAYGSNINDAVAGGDGNDWLGGGSGKDVLHGGKGNDLLCGSEGSDTYVFNLGDGQDTIQDTDSTGKDKDVIQFGKGITPADLEFVKEDVGGWHNLRINIKGTTDSIVIQGYFGLDGWGADMKIDKLRFADGTILTKADLDTIGYKVYGTSGNDSYMTGTSGRDEIYGYEGNDWLNGNAGDDTLDGGAGNDLLYGGTGNDTYKFGIGSGQDTISDGYYGTSTDSNLDTVEFGEGISVPDLEFVKENYDLRINIKGTTDSLLISNWFGSNLYKIEQLKFADGTILTPADVDAIGYKMYGTAGNDTLSGTNVNDEMYGYDGNDTLQGNAGNDILDGGAGNDMLYGYAGNDTYRFGIGYGQDTINDSDSTAGNTDTVEFGAGITASDLELVKEYNNQRINIKGTTDSLIIQNWFYGDYNKIEQLKFADGSVLTPADLDAIGYKVYGTTGNDYSLQGSSANDEIYGYDGNDSLTGNAGNDILNGGAGNDTLQGNAGDDTMDGGAGDDTLYGGTGNDTYKFGIGSGTDTISDYDTTAGNTDTVEFGAGITASDLELVKESGNLRINIKGASDSLIIQSWFSGNNYRIEQFKFADGTVLTPANLDAIGYKMYGAAGNDILSGSTVNDEMYGNAGNDTLTGDAGNDVLDGGAGNDTLNGGIGNDTYKFNLGTGVETINDYATDYAATIDTVEFGAGITAGDIELFKENNNFRINIKGATDVLVIQSWFSGDYYKIEQFKFADGTTLSKTVIDAMDKKVYGTVNNDSLSGSTANDTINSYEGNDYLYGNSGNDVLDGGAGNDYLQGDAGNDTYKFNLGYGQETINDYAADNATTIDTVEFGAGINSSNLELVKEGNNMRIKINGTTDSLVIQNYFYNNTYRVEQFKFADGTVLTSANFDAIGYKVYGTAGNDSLQGSNVNDEIYGNSGNDYLYGNAGNDTLDGGAGNDTLNGGAGNDVYKFNPGDGADIINDYDATAGNKDTVQAGVNPLDLIFSKSGNNLIVNINGTTDQTTVQNFYVGAAYQTEVFKASDGSQLLNTQVDLLIQAMATLSTNTGLSWSQLIQSNPNDVQAVLAQYWAPQP